jgi:fumarate hydratase, class II
LPQGGTAIGTGINCHPEFAHRFSASLSSFTEMPFTSSDNKFAGIASQDLSVATMGALASLSSCLMKISNDLRWMNSGPLSGLAEIELEALQPGSSIMPGKVNPVIPEAVAMACAQVLGNQTTVSVAAQSGNFQLNVMLPVIAYNMLQSTELMTSASYALADQAIANFSVNASRMESALAKNPILVTALNPEIGYEKAAKIAKKAYQEKRPVLDVADEMTDLGRDKLTQLLDPTKLTQGGLGESSD